MSRSNRTEKLFVFLVASVFMFPLLTGLTTAAVPPDTTPSTECSGNYFLEADGDCIAEINAGTDSQTLEQVLTQGTSAGSYNIDMSGNKIIGITQLDGNGGNHRIRFDSSSSWIEFTDQSNNRQDIVTQDVYINDHSVWLGDDNIGTVNAGDYMSGGGSFGLTGSVTLDVNDNWVDEGGDTMSGNLSFGGSYQINNLLDPSNPQDAATKDYVDTQAAESMQTLEEVLGQGNSAGSYSINMNGNDITNLDDLSTQNGVTVDDSERAVRYTDYIEFNNIEFSDIPNNEFVMGIDNSEEPQYYHNGAWRRFWTDYNDGSGSGLNADLLDGSHISGVRSHSGDTLTDNTVDNSEIQNSDSFSMGGLTLSGNLNMNSNNVTNLEYIEHAGTGIEIVWQAGENDIEFQHYTSPGTDFMRIDYDNSEVLLPDSNLDMGGERINNLNGPSADSDAATKGYVDTQAGGATQNLEQVLGQGNSAGSYNIDMNGNNILSGGVCPDGSCSSGNEWFESGGIHTTNIYAGSGGEIDIQDTIELNDNPIDDNTGPIDFQAGGSFAGNINMNENNIVDLGGGTASISGGDIQFQPSSSGGTAGLSFQSNANSGSDGGWLTWYDDNNNYNYWGDSSENGALVLGTTNDNQVSTSDVTVLKSPAAAVIDSPELYMDGASLNMNGNSINNYFSGGCGDNSHVTGINSDGTIQCGSDSGDITEVVAGNQLTGGSTSGSATIDLNEGSGSGLNADQLDGSHISGVRSHSGDTLTDNTVDNSEIQNSDSFSMGGLTMNGNINVNGNSVSNAGSLEMDGNVEINNGGATGTNVVRGSRELYAGDETEVTTTGTDVLKKELTFVFNSDYGKSPSYINVIARMSSNAEVDVTANGVTKTLSGSGLQTATFDTSGWADGTHPVDVYLTSTDSNTASHDIIEFYYVQ